MLSALLDLLGDAPARPLRGVDLRKMEPNDNRLFGMFGNVLEWCQLEEDVISQIGGGVLHAPLLGGSWDPRDMPARDGVRVRQAITRRSSRFGFRMVAEKGADRQTPGFDHIP